MLTYFQLSLLDSVQNLQQSYLNTPPHSKRVTTLKVKGKVFPYSLPSVGPGADPGVQAVSPQVT